MLSFSLHSSNIKRFDIVCQRQRVNVLISVLHDVLAGDYDYVRLLFIVKRRTDRLRQLDERPVSLYRSEPHHTSIRRYISLINI